MAAPKEPEPGGAAVATRTVRGAQPNRCLLLPPSWSRRRDSGGGAVGGRCRHAHASEASRATDTRCTYVHRAGVWAHAEDPASHPHRLLCPVALLSPGYLAGSAGVRGPQKGRVWNRGLVVRLGVEPHLDLDGGLEVLRQGT